MSEVMVYEERVIEDLEVPMYCEGYQHIMTSDSGIELIETSFTIDKIVEKYVGDKGDRTLIITNNSNRDRIGEYSPHVHIAYTNKESELNKLLESTDCDRVIALGGGTAHDIGRSYVHAKGIDKENLIVVPTILSTSCIASDKAVMHNDKGERLETHSYIAIAPSRVIYNPEYLAMQPKEIRERWSKAGYGDALTRISAAIDWQSKHGTLDREHIEESARETFDILEYLRHEFKGYDNEGTMAHLAKSSFISSHGVLDSPVTVAGEHQMYNVMMDTHDHYRALDPQNRPAHGTIVALGTLLSTKIFAEQTGDNSLFQGLRDAYDKIDLPIDAEGLQKEHIEKNHIKDALQTISSDNSYLGTYFRENGSDMSIVDEVFP